jgi:hypothetical protein
MDDTAAGKAQNGLDEGHIVFGTKNSGKKAIAEHSVRGFLKGASGSERSSTSTTNSRWISGERIPTDEGCRFTNVGQPIARPRSHPQAADGPRGARSLSRPRSSCTGTDGMGSVGGRRRPAVARGSPCSRASPLPDPMASCHDEPSPSALPISSSLSNVRWLGGLGHTFGRGS